LTISDKRISIYKKIHRFTLTSSQKEKETIFKNIFPKKISHFFLSYHFNERNKKIRSVQKAKNSQKWRVIPVQTSSKMALGKMFH